MENERLPEGGERKARRICQGSRQARVAAHLLITEHTECPAPWHWHRRVRSAAAHGCPAMVNAADTEHVHHGRKFFWVALAWVIYTLGPQIHCSSSKDVIGPPQSRQNGGLPAGSERHQVSRAFQYSGGEFKLWGPGEDSTKDLGLLALRRHLGPLCGMKRQPLAPAGLQPGTDG